MIEGATHVTREPSSGALEPALSFSPRIGESMRLRHRAVLRGRRWRLRRRASCTSFGPDRVGRFTHSRGRLGICTARHVRRRVSGRSVHGRRFSRRLSRVFMRKQISTPSRVAPSGVASVPYPRRVRWDARALLFVSSRVTKSCIRAGGVHVRRSPDFGERPRRGERRVLHDFARYVVRMPQLPATDVKGPPYVEREFRSDDGLWVQQALPSSDRKSLSPQGGPLTSEAGGCGMRTT